MDLLLFLAISFDIFQSVVKSDLKGDKEANDVKSPSHGKFMVFPEINV